MKQKKLFVVLLKIKHCNFLTFLIQYLREIGKSSHWKLEIKHTKHQKAFDSRILPVPTGI